MISVVLTMPKKHHVGSLSKTGPQFSRKASGRKNAEHQSVGLSYAAARPSSDYNRLRDVEQGEKRLAKSSCGTMGCSLLMCPVVGSVANGCLAQAVAWMMI